MKTKLFLILLLTVSLFSCNKKKEIFDYTIIPVKSGDKWGYVDATGNEVIQPRFDQAYDFDQRLALVELDEKWGYVDRQGRIY